MLTHHEEAAEEERWPLTERDPAVTARPYEEAGIRLATGSLNHEREVAKGRPAWLALIFRAADRVEGAVRRLLRMHERGADELDDLESFPWTGDDHSPPGEREGWRLREADPAMDEWIRSMGIRPARYSLDHPRPVMNQLPAWLAIPLNRLGLRR